MASTRSGRTVVRPAKFAISQEEEIIIGDLIGSTSSPEIIVPTSNINKIKHDHDLMDEFIDLHSNKIETDMLELDNSDTTRLNPTQRSDPTSVEDQTILSPSSEPSGGNFPQWWVRLSQTFHSYLGCSYLVDLWILCDFGHMVPAHQLILAHASPILKAWLAQVRAECQEETVTISLPYVDHLLVSQFVDAVYLGRLPEEPEDQVKVCELAKRLGVPLAHRKPAVVRLSMIDNIVSHSWGEGDVKPVDGIQLTGIRLKSDVKPGVVDTIIKDANSMESMCVEMMAQVAMEDFVGSQVAIEGAGFLDKASDIPEDKENDTKGGLVDAQPLGEFQAMEKDLLKTKEYKMQQIKKQQERSCSNCKKSAISHRREIQNPEGKAFWYQCCLANCSYDKMKTARAFNGHMTKHKKIPDGQNETSKKTCPLCKKSRIKHKNVDITHWPNGMKLKGNLYKCCQCAASKLNSKKFFIHTENHVAKKFVCDVCQKGYSYKHLLQEHVWKEHGEGQHIRFTCSWTGCDYSAKYKQTLYAHVMEKHHGITKKHPLRRPKDAQGEPISSNVECPTCNKSLGRRYYEKVHKPTCAGAEVIYQCEICGKEGFINSVTLQNHVRSKHSADRPYQCEYCPAKFATSESLSHHRSSRHGVNAKGDVVPKKMYPCNRCGKLLTSRLKLLKHIEVLHEGKRDFRCNYCEKSFGSKSNLQIHEGSIHTGILPYKCEYCSKMFSRRQLLVNHRDTMHPGHEGPIYIVEDVNCVQVDEMIVPVQTMDGGVGFTVGMDGVVQGVSMA